MTKIWTKAAIYAVLAAAIITMSMLYTENRRHIKTLKVQVKEQSTVIDSLLARRMTVFDVRLNVTDRSQNIVHGRYNRGTINVSQERIYRLEVDSVKIGIRN